MLREIIFTILYVYTLKIKTINNKINLVNIIYKVLNFRKVINLGDN